MSQPGALRRNSDANRSSRRLSVEAAGPPRVSALISPCAAECSPLPPRFARLVARRQEEGQATEVRLSVGCPSFSAGASEWVA